jgi:hypothetical protein
MKIYLQWDLTFTYLDTGWELHGGLPGLKEDRHELQADPGVGGLPLVLRL